MSKQILLIGGGGHCKSVIDTLVKNNEYQKIGIVDEPRLVGEKVLGIDVIGSDTDLAQLKLKGFDYAFVTIASQSLLKKRIKLFNELEKLGFIIPNIIDQTAILASKVGLQHGIYVGKSVIINSSAVIKKGTILNTASLIEHDSIIDDFCHIAPRACIAGNCKIGKNTFVGMNASIKQNTSVGNNVVIGMGAVVLNNVEDNLTVIGNPGKVR